MIFFQQKAYHCLSRKNPSNLIHPRKLNYISSHSIGMFVARVLRGALKLRYLVLGGAVSGAGALANVSNIFEIWP